MGRGRRQGGFSLLEMLVAVSILALTLGVLYQAASGATRNVRSAQRYAYAVELARSLVADSSVVPLQGLRRAGETAAGFRWEVLAQPVDRPRGSPLAGGYLQYLTVEVNWPDGPRLRQVSLNTVVVGEALQ